MSSVKDRIRNLQSASTEAAAADGAGPSVAARARAVEGNDEASHSSLSERARAFVKAPTGGPGLGARVAQFDTKTEGDVQERMRKLQAGIGGEGRVIEARAAAFERGVAEREVEKEGGLGDVRAAFESGNIDKKKNDDDVRSAFKNVEREVQKGNAVDVSNVRTAFETRDKSERNVATSGKDGVTRQAETFESGKRGGSLDRHVPQTDDKIKAGVEKGSEAQRSVQEELREVKKTNEQLVSTLLELSASFKRLEITRDSLQKRLLELEKK